MLRYASLYRMGAYGDGALRRRLLEGFRRAGKRLNIMTDQATRNRATIEALVAALNARDLTALDRVFTEDVVLEWPQSGERIVGGEKRRAIYSRFPSLPTVTPRRITGTGDVWVLEASFDYGDGDPYQCVFVFQLREGLIAKEVAYWAKPFPAPDWRAPWVERFTP